MRIGGKHMKEIDVRLVAATNTDLLEATRLKKFRSDLYYRLNVFAIHLPPLRDRPEDILPLATHFMRAYGHSLGKSVREINGAARELLQRHTWPGNIRELENIIERAVVIAGTDTIGEENLPDELRTPARAAVKLSTDMGMEYEALKSRNNDFTPSTDFPLSPEVTEQRSIVNALTIEVGHVPSAAVRLGVPLRKLYRRIKKFNIDLDNFRKW